MKMRFTSILTFLCLGLTVVATAQDPVTISFGNLQMRSIGPAVMSGRISCVDGINAKPEVFYIGAANGGVWKTTNGGATFDAVFDDHIQSIGDLRIDQAHPDTVWVGTGEPWVRNSVSVGDGIYLTTNGGRNWKHLGLEGTERIAKVLINPSDPAKVYVAAQGPLWNASEQRGLYKTTDFGASWVQVKYIDPNTGCADLTMHPQHPDTLIAAFWDHRRSPDFFRSGGPGSGLYKTTDGGDTWTKITRGLPEGTLGRMAVEFAPSDPNIVYLTVEAEKQEDKGLYQSTDGGESFSRVNGEFGTTVRPFYFSRLTVDPNDADKVYKCGLNLIVSEDGGQGFRTVGSGVHSDIHAVWVPASNSKFVVIGTDGGGYRSLDGGYTFEMFMNLPLSQFYHVSVDDADPYHVYGGLQDNGSWYGPSQSPGGVSNADWSLSNWGDGFYSFRHPTDAHIIYSESQGGNLVRYDLRDGQSKDIKPLPEEDEPKYRFNWNTPIHLSGAQPDRLYVGAQYLFRSEDRGDTWARISPDLTTNDTSRQRQAQSGGLSIDNSTAENNTTIYTISESPLNDQVIWVGTDDGNLQITRDGGNNWENVAPNIQGLPAFTWCSHVLASAHNEGEVYVTFDGHKQGDMTPYVFHSEDYGKTWTSLVTEEVTGYAHVILQDIVEPDLLFLGTEFGLYISLDGGLSWKRFEERMPGVAVRAMAIQPREQALVIATHGRGIYILDDLTPLRQVRREILDSTLVFFDLPPAVVKLPRSGKPFGGAGNFVGQNPSNAATIAYYMRKRHTFGKMTLEVKDAEGNVIQSLPPGKSAGINIVSLPLRMPPPKAAPTKNRMALAGSIITPSLQEGTYTVTIAKGRDTFEHKLTLAPDPASIYTVSERSQQQELLASLYDMTNNLGHMYHAMEDMHQQAEARDVPEASLKATLKDFADRVAQYKATLVSLEGDFYVDEGEALREEISTLYLSVSSYPGQPSMRQVKKTRQLEDRMQTVSDQFDQFSKEAADINRSLKENNLAPITWKDLETYLKG